MNKTLSGAAALVLLASQAARADFVDLLGSFSTPLENESAQAAWDTYENLLNSGCDDAMLVDPGVSAQGQQASCSGRTFRIFSNVRELVHTGNELTGKGATRFSLGSTKQGLGFALRWLAAEEYSSQGDMSSDFVSGQMVGLSARLTALRFGARGFQFAQGGVWQGGDYAGIYGSNGGSAGSEIGYSQWGGFLNFQYGSGTHDPTGLEDAFDLKTYGLTGGLDYRLDDRWVVGTTLGYSDEQIDFDAALSVVEGGIKTKGYSVMPFFMFQQGNYYVSGSLGYQSLSFDSERYIRYPSFNPDLPSTNTETVSSSNASVISAFAETGYDFIWKAFTVEPYINLNSSSITIDEFVEDDLNNDGFDLVIQKQSFSTLDASLGTKFQYTFTWGNSVFVPYLTLEQVSQLQDSPRTVDAYYAGLPFQESTFHISTDKEDGAYGTVNFGMSAVLRGGQQKKLGGTIGGDIQAFFNIKKIIGLENYTLNFYSLGIRVAF